MILNGILSLAVYCNMIHIQSCYSVTAITNKYYAIKKHVQYIPISLGCEFIERIFFFKITTSGIRNYRYSIKLKIQQLQVHAL